MKNFYLTAVLLLMAVISNAQERVNATLPAISGTTKGRITEAIGWMQNDEGTWVSRKNRIPANMPNEYKDLLDSGHDGLGHNRENFIYMEMRDVVIKDSSYTILIKKYKDGYYQYEHIMRGWTPENSLTYFVFPTSELERLKNLEPDKIHNIKIKSLYTNTIQYLSPKASITTIAEDLHKFIQKNDFFNMSDLIISVKFYKDKARFVVDEYWDIFPPDVDKAYYETPIANFEKLFVLK